MTPLSGLRNRSIPSAFPALDIWSNWTPQSLRDLLLLQDEMLREPAALALAQGRRRITVDAGPDSQWPDGATEVIAQSLVVLRDETVYGKAQIAGPRLAARFSASWRSESHCSFCESRREKPAAWYFAPGRLDSSGCRDTASGHPELWNQVLEAWSAMALP